MGDPMNQRESRRLAVVGGGIGGLCAAALLSRKGFDVTVFEQAAELGEVGAGLQIGPNGVKVLQRLGLGQALDEVGVRPRHLVLRDGKTGLVVSRTAIAGDFESAYGAPYYHIHRADLLDMLHRVAKEGERILTGSKVTGVHSGPEGTRLDVGGKTQHFDAVVGADGIHSVVRPSLIGNQAPRFTGNVAFRALVPADDKMRRTVPMDSTIWLGPGGHVVHYYVRGGALLNIVAVYETERWTDESWSQLAQSADLLAAFRGWNRSLMELLSRVEQCNRWALHDRDPLQKWGMNSTTLLGDAAHPMLPFLAQGAVMAIEDAYVLASELANCSDTPAALRRYEGQRIRRTSRIQLAARARGEAMHMSDWRDAWRRNAKLFLRSRFTRDDQIEKGKGLYGFDVTAAPRPSLATEAAA